MSATESGRKFGRRRKACLLFRNINSLGGQARVAISILRSLSRSGYETTLFCRKKIDYNSIKENFGLSVHLDKQAVFPFWPYMLRTYYEFVLPGIAKSFSGMVINPYTSDILPYVDITYIHYPNTLLIKEKMKNLFWESYYKAYESIERSSSFRGPEKLVLANSCFTADAVRKEFNVDPVVLYPPVDLCPFVRGMQEMKKDLVVTVSRFSSEKGLDRIPEIAKNINAKFVVLGSLFDWELYRRVLENIRRNNVSGKVILVPNAPVDVKIKLLQEAKIYFHSAPYESFGISIVEGMGAGCIPIVSDEGAPKEFVPEKWRYKSEGDAVSKIESALNSWSPSVGREMRTVASRFGTERFENNFSEILNLYVAGKKVVTRDVTGTWEEG